MNISGGEFGTVPGRIGYNYIYPNTFEIRYFAARGFKVLRIPFRWERLQPELYGPLAAVDRAEIKKVVKFATAKGLVVVLDMHDYAHRRATPNAPSSSLIGSAEVPETAFADAWRKIAADYADNPNVWLGLMNEPSGGVSVGDWWHIAQQVVNDLRAARIPNKVLVPGIYWSAAYAWIKSGNAAYAETFVDPGANYAFEVHQYLDQDSSGTSPSCEPGAAQRVDDVLAWAQEQRAKLFFGEFAAGPDAICKAEYTSMLSKLNTNPAVIGWTAWGGGAWWNPTYPFRLESTGSGPMPHMVMLKANLPG